MTRTLLLSAIVAVLGAISVILRVGATSAGLEIRYDRPKLATVTPIESARRSA